ncbi:MAG TPA: glycosyltransferase family 4 protein [Aromatoleum sp.]|uniref:glycosyltransferase family 4 protein n=1 Tax=Aromatoleum sp. TaxID=2307007 RepID=UPI002B483A0A|nr:glycosyltransferase family 4 protein [Aromatoleum sp.]HJV25771.1 glycosyltransferase family 4 protein [Aromatoleum sp.]
MNFLFVHQNLPGQFAHVARALADDAAHRVVGIGDANMLRNRPTLHPRIQIVGYESPARGHRETHHYIRDFEGHIRRGQSVMRAAQHLGQQGFRPDVVVAHPGWGEALFLRDAFPEARHINYFEYYYRGRGGDVGFDPEFPTTLDDRLRVRVKNSTQLQSLVSCDHGLAPTRWQKQRFPAEFQPKIEVIHEGVDTTQVRPDATACVCVAGQTLKAGDEIVTYVARNLEPYRGFHTFMRALPALLRRRPNARVLIAGGDEVSYGARLPNGSFRELYCRELGDTVDWSRVHFLGKLPYAQYLKVLQVSAAHIYLTYPFVLSWSMLEAMAAGCALVASATEPVQEVLRHGDNGLLVDFFDAQALADTVSQVLQDPVTASALRLRARQTIVDHYDLRTRCLPRMLDFLTLRA